jgi:flagellar biosynthesis protein FlhB
VADPQKTHKPTPKRVREFRQRGEIALSRDVVSAVTLGGGVIGLIVCAGASGTALLQLTRDAANATDGSNASWLPSAATKAFLVAAGPVMLGAAAAALVATLGQLGWPPAFKTIKIDLARLSPLTNLKATFSLGAMTRRTGTALAKVAVVGAIVVLALRHGVAAHQLHAGAIAAVAWSVVTRALWFVLGALLALGAIDYFFARRRMTDQMMMSTEELKREHREQEGDPQLKGKRKSRMRELAKRRMATAVATADVVVVNPTHYAVALRYDETTDRAPVVVAKGVDELAEKIREVARKHSVPILSRPPLARALHKHVKEGRPVPSNLFRAVAEVLAYVYRLRNRGNS